MEVIIFFRLFSFDYTFESTFVYFSFILVFGAILFFVIKATNYKDLVYILFSIISYDLLKIMKLLFNTFVYDLQHDSFGLSIMTKSIIYGSMFLLLFGTLSGSIVIMLNKRALNKGLNKEATEKENGDDLINEE